MEISDYAHYTVFLHWLHSLRCFISLLLKLNIWLRSLRCFTSLTTLTMQSFFTTVKMKSLTTLTKLFYFTPTNPRDRTTLTTLLLSLIDEIVFPQEFQCFHKIYMCHSNFTVRKFSGILHALLPVFWYKFSSIFGVSEDFEALFSVRLKKFFCTNFSVIQPHVVCIYCLVPFTNHVNAVYLAFY